MVWVGGALSWASATMDLHQIWSARRYGREACIAQARRYEKMMTAWHDCYLRYWIPQAAQWDTVA